jgi:predicted GIY-YIG superfamily endonuclease
MRFKKGQRLDVNQILHDDKRKYVYIYKITNVRSKKFYIGQTTNLKARVYAHITGKGSRVGALLGNSNNWRIKILQEILINESVYSSRSENFYKKVLTAEWRKIQRHNKLYPGKSINSRADLMHVL